MLAQLEMFINLRFTRAAETDKENRSMEYGISKSRFYYSIKFLLAERVYLNNCSSLLLDNLEFHSSRYYIYIRCKDRFNTIRIALYNNLYNKFHNILKSESEDRLRTDCFLRYYLVNSDEIRFVIK